MKRLALGSAFTALVIFLTLPVFAAEQAKEKPSWWYKDVVDASFVTQYATVPPKKEVLIVDSRPARKYNKGHIVPAINISNSQFDKMTHLLPQNKSNLLIFYCGGLKCPLSHKSAAKAEALGYTNVKVYAAGFPDWVKNGGLPPGVSAAHVKMLIDKNKGATIVDARPARKFKKGHLPGAINVPLRQFDKLVDRLPADKNSPLIFYCGGYKCPLSPKSAVKAVAMGYTKVRLFQAGYPAWKKAYGDAIEKTAEAKPAAAPKIEAGEDEGTISIASFNTLATNNPEDFYWYDVRDPEEVESDGTFAKAVIMTVDEVEENVDKLPTDKPIVFFCSTGARSGEAYDLVMMKREDLKIYFLDANVAFNPDGSVPKATPLE
ncbi:MAG: rhodanese-like domain-containing protein [Candidatus Thiodiazotropha endolucinida]